MYPKCFSSSCYAKPWKIASRCDSCRRIRAPQKPEISRRSLVAGFPLLIASQSTGAEAVTTQQRVQLPKAHRFSRFMRCGPWKPSSAIEFSFPISLPGGSSQTESATDVFVRVTTPVGREGYLEQPTSFPLAIFSTGFMVASAMYNSYATDLASWGYVVVQYDIGTIIEDKAMLSAMREALQRSIQHPSVAPVADPQRQYLIGHSRGGKLSVLAAAEDDRVQALCLLDPVDNNSFTPLGPGWPAAAPLLSQLTDPQGRGLPVAIVGAALGKDCAPLGSNYRVFESQCRGPLWSLELSEAGHMQFLDGTGGLLAAVCAAGAAANADVAGIAKAVMVAFGEVEVKGCATRGAPTEAALTLLEEESSALNGVTPLKHCLQGFA